MLCKKEATIFHIYSKKILHINLIKVQAFFCKIFEEFNNDPYLWKSEATTIKSALSGLRKFLATESPLKMMKNAFISP